VRTPVEMVADLVPILGSVALISSYSMGLALTVVFVGVHAISIWFGLLCIAGILVALFEEIRILNSRRQSSDLRGFEVKLTPGMTPGLIEKKEDDHG
jgi:hypothetical protein